MSISDFYKEKYREKDLIAIQLIKEKEYSCTKAAKELGLDQQSLSSRLKKYYGITFLPDGKKEINSNFFDNIDTEEKAYWLGFFFADGYIDNKNGFDLVLCEEDYEHVKKFKEALKSKHKIGLKNVKLDNKIFKACRLNIKDKNIHNKLIEYGCVNNKSLVVEFPNINIFTKKRLIKDFIRGYFDGNGSIGIDKKGYYKVQITSGSYAFLETLSLLLDDLNIKSYIYHTEKRKNVYDLKFQKENRDKFLKYIYRKSTIYLDRKYEKYCRLYKKA